MANGLPPHVVDYGPSFLGQSRIYDDLRQHRFNEEVTKVLAPSAYERQTGPVYPAGPKSCSQCGTTRTPQWREGPEGPKTLCNACGVKVNPLQSFFCPHSCNNFTCKTRVRQMRALPEGDRRRVGKSPAHLHKQESTDLPLSDDTYNPKDSSQRRPMRKAAPRVAAKVADSCSKPVWPGEEEEEQCYPSASQCTGSDSGGHNSDSAEELACWVPQRQPNPRHAPPSPMAALVGPECAAAVNLLCMSVPAEPLGQHRAPSGNAARDGNKINAASFAQMANTALKWSSHLPAQMEAQESIREALRHLPGDRHAEMLLVKEELDAVARDAAAADAAVAAVAKILAMKQAAAIRSRTAAAQAAKRIHAFMQSLEQEYGWSRQAAQKRQRQQ